MAVDIILSCMHRDTAYIYIYIYTDFYLEIDIYAYDSQGKIYESTGKDL